MIPQDKSAAVSHGLRDAFGVTEFDEIRPLTGGHTTSLVFRIVVKGSPYVLKMIMRTDDPTRHFTSMKAAADAGLAPRVRHSSIPDRLLITDFIHAVPLPMSDAIPRMAAVLRRLHALPPFPGIEDRINTSCMFLLNRGPALDAFLHRLKEASPLPKAETEELFALHARLAAVYPLLDADMVSSHNDLFKPDNILFDGERLWLVDWETAFLNNRYADLAAVANLIVTNDEEEDVFLREYFGRTPDEFQQARFFIMRQLSHVFYTMALLFLPSAGELLNLADPAPGLGVFHQRMWAGEVNLSDRRTKILHGRAHWEQLLRNTRQSRYEESLRIVATEAPGAAPRRAEPRP